MSRLEEFTNRFLSQAAAINEAAEHLTDVPGVIIELGLGKGRTFDHLRERFPDREIYVFDRELSCEQEYAPPHKYRVFGDIRKTLPSFCNRFHGQVAFAHSDIGTKDRQKDAPLTQFVVSQLTQLLTLEGALLASDRPMEAEQWHELPLLPEFKVWRYHMYRSLGKKS